MNVVNPSAERRRNLVLPNSRERNSIKSNSLEELEEELNRYNEKADARTRNINKAIVIISLLTTIALLSTKSTDSPSKKSFKFIRISKLIKRIGLTISIISLIKGYTSLSSKIQVVDSKNPDLNKFKNSLREDDINPNLGSGNSKRQFGSNDEKRNLKKIAVRAAADSLLEDKIVTRQELSNRSRYLKNKKINGVDKDVIQTITKEYS